MQIFVKSLTGKTFTFEVQLSDTVESVKAKIQHQEGIELDLQTLLFKGRQLQDDKTLESYDVESESIIHLMVAIRAENSKLVFVKTVTGKTLKFDFDPNDTVEIFKKKIQEKEGFPVEQQKLMFAGEYLENGKFLVDYQIQNDSTMRLEMDIPKQAEEEDDIGGLFG